jgi:hypothetical protein
MKTKFTRKERDDAVEKADREQQQSIRLALGDQRVTRRFSIIKDFF